MGNGKLLEPGPYLSEELINLLIRSKPVFKFEVTTKPFSKIKKQCKSVDKINNVVLIF